jgi:hypothetical protein
MPASRGVPYALLFLGNLRFSRLPVGRLPFGTAKIGGLFGWASCGLRNKLSEGCKWLGLGEKKSLKS